MTEETRKQLEARWPNIVPIMHIDHVMKHMAKWTEEHDPSEHGPAEFQEELERYYAKCLLAVPHEEVCNALGETLASKTYAWLVEKAEARLASSLR